MFGKGYSGIGGNDASFVYAMDVGDKGMISDVFDGGLIVEKQCGFENAHLLLVEEILGLPAVQTYALGRKTCK